MSSTKGSTFGRPLCFALSSFLNGFRFLHLHQLLRHRLNIQRRQDGVGAEGARFGGKLGNTAVIHAVRKDHRLVPGLVQQVVFPGHTHQFREGLEDAEAALGHVGLVPDIQQIGLLRTSSWISGKMAFCVPLAGYPVNRHSTGVCVDTRQGFRRFWPISVPDIQ